MKAVLGVFPVLAWMWLVWWFNLGFLNLNSWYPGGNDPWDNNWPWWQFPLIVTEILVFIILGVTTIMKSTETKTP